MKFSGWFIAALLKFLFIDVLQMINVITNWWIFVQFSTPDETGASWRWTFINLVAAWTTPFVIWWYQGLKSRLLRRHRILQDDTITNYLCVVLLTFSHYL